MTERKQTWVRAAAALLGAATLGTTLPGCPEQPELACPIPNGPYSARYDLVEGTPECAQAQALTGDLIGVELYYPQSGGRQDLRRPSLALQPAEIGTPFVSRTGGDPGNVALAQGELRDSKPANGFCTIPTLTPAQVTFPEVPPTPPAPDAGSDAGTPGEPAVSMRYEWSNVRFLMTPSAPGHAFDADLSVTLAGCTAKYKVNAVFYYKPFVPGANPYCAPAHFDSEQDSWVVDGPPDDRFCSPKSNPAIGHSTGSSVNPLFRTRCLPETLSCVLEGSVTDYR